MLYIYISPSQSIPVSTTQHYSATTQPLLRDRCKIVKILSSSSSSSCTAPPRRPPRPPPSCSPGSSHNIQNGDYPRSMLWRAFPNSMRSFAGASFLVVCWPASSPPSCSLRQQAEELSRRQHGRYTSKEYTSWRCHANGFSNALIIIRVRTRTRTTDSSLHWWRGD